MDVRVAAILALLAGCRANCEPTISGGTGAERAELDTWIARFYDLLRPDLDLCVPHVEIVQDVEDASGLYNTASRRVTLQPVLGVLSHELCHGVQIQNDLPVDPYRPTPGSVLDVLEKGDPSEVFADFCAIGPRFSVFLDEDCPDDPPGFDLYRESAALFVGSDETWVDVDVVPELVPTVSIETDADAFSLATGPEGLVVALGDRPLSLDPWTGRIVPLPDDPAPVGLVGETTQGVAEKFAYDTVDGEVGYRWVVHRDRWVSLGCADASHQVFAWDDWLWSARLDGGTFTIGVWLLQ